MTYVITQPCCNDASCVAVCPVNCIHPRPDEPNFMTAEMLYIDPDTCIDCAACIAECPVDAILSEDDLEEHEVPYLAINAAYYEKHPVADGTPDPPATRKSDYSGLRVAIVGSGPAACYAATDLMSCAGVNVNMFERLHTPLGLIRSGVAPDHPGTKRVSESFRPLWSKPGFTMTLGVEIGKDLSHDELLQHHHAVIYAHGASADRRLGIPGEDLQGSHAASEFVAWYNGHPDYVSRDFDLTGNRAVIIGNGNVALDIARILMTDPDELGKTDIADHALAALRKSNLTEVVVVGRRGPAHSAFTNSELLALTSRTDLDVVVDVGDFAASGIDPFALADPEPSARIKAELLGQLVNKPLRADRKRIVLRYYESPVAVLGDESVQGIRLATNSTDSVSIVESESHDIETGLVLRSIGYRGVPLKDVPFDEARGIVPNEQGRVVDPSSGTPVTGVYTTGWIKRGPSGGIGTNKLCAAQTVACLLEDFDLDKLEAPHADHTALEVHIKTRVPDAIDFAGWSDIDRAERAAGAKLRRPRVKFVDVTEMLGALRIT
ncbi:FAD-dependent oxidoreductase [Rhodococcus rhodochrous]|uniref:ferredoxin--NADP(+) reductase n=1 Tax=Rhodococcus rhodochrous KG-21 TaxID=1441923 RepID=A0A0M9WPH8_RHORH|nr:FAD-dependent oxidoreductase [Rhodococcus rhodochrous]KOS56713.1 ferredoxin [Rhodococcus rhodochrous KG-21]